jgi:hypothetical protein
VPAMTNPIPTPGPWRATGVNVRAVCTDHYADERTLESEKWANAMLMAAAPEMRDVLQQLVSLWDLGIRPQPVIGMLREENDFAQAIRTARSILEQ